MLTQKEKVRVQTLHVHVKLCMNPHFYDNDITYMYLLHY